MKIEIELQEVENLRNKVAYLEGENEKLKKQIHDLNEDELKGKAVSLSWRLFENYISAVFEKLGFENHNQRCVRMIPDLQNELGRTWWTSQRLTVDVSIEVSNQFRKAFLDLGYTPKENQEENNEDKIFNL